MQKGARGWGLGARVRAGGQRSRGAEEKFQSKIQNLKSKIALAPHPSPLAPNSGLCKNSYKSIETDCVSCYHPPIAQATAIANHGGFLFIRILRVRVRTIRKRGICDSRLPPAPLLLLSFAPSKSAPSL